MIIGRPGSGKSTFAVALGKKWSIPVHHLDKYFFESGWKERDYESFLKDQQDLVSQNQWIIDGNAIQSFEMRYSKADVCLYFNFPKPLCYWRVLKRLFKKDADIDDRANNCQETVRWSLLKYIWHFEDRVSARLEELKNNYPNVRYIELHNDKDVMNLFDVL